MREVKAAARWPRRGSLPLMRLVAISVFVAAAFNVAISAQAQDRHSPAEMMFGGPPEHARRAVDHLLDGLNASEAQRSQIRQIAIAASADLAAQRDVDRNLREKALQIFTAPTVDATAAEAVRQQISAQHDQGSKRMLQAMLDAAKVLTPEQRAKLGDRMRERQAVMQDRMQRMQQERQERAPRGARTASQPGPQK
jgi:periplasmic protein CpxP/Spy